MKQNRFIFSPFFALAVLFILSVSVAPVMASNAVNKDMNIFSSGSSGMGSFSSNIGIENNKCLAPENSRGISVGSSVPEISAKSESESSAKSSGESTPWDKKCFDCKH
jgi:hypothetical protein